LKTSPIALFVYNRPNLTRHVLLALRKNKLFRSSKLFIFSDGPKDNDSDKSVNKVRNVLSHYNNLKNINITLNKDNKGLSTSIITGVSNILSDFKSVIVLEDDLITSTYFLKYMNTGLSLYEKETDVASIHSYFYPVNSINQLPNYFFLKGADCWGWATWRDRWDLFENNPDKLLNKINSMNLSYEFSLEKRAGFYNMLKDTCKGKIDSWAIRWHASMYLQNKLTLYPKVSFIHNIGNDGSGTHKAKTDSFKTKINLNFDGIKNIQLTENLIAREKLANFMLKIREPLYKRLLKKYII
jgi:hypothetical protein